MIEKKITRRIACMKCYGLTVYGTATTVVMPPGDIGHFPCTVTAVACIIHWHCATNCDWCIYVAVVDSFLHFFV